MTMHVRSVVVGVDGSDASMEALRFAAVEAALRHVPLRVVHGVSVPITEVPSGETRGVDVREERARRLVDNALVAVGADLDGVEVESVVRSGGGASVLLDTVSADDLLVVGSRGLGGFRGLLLGSVSQQLVTHAPCAVVVVRTSADR